MKKILGFLLVVVLLASCGGSRGDSAKSKSDVIKASELISRKEAEKLLGKPMEDRVLNVRRAFSDENRYVSDEYNFSIVIIQESLHDKTKEVESNMLKDGWMKHMDLMKEAYYMTYPVIDLGIADSASFLYNTKGTCMWTLHVFYGEYYISVMISDVAPDCKDTAEKIAWKQAKLKEAASMAVERLKTILKKR